MLFGKYCNDLVFRVGGVLPLDFLVINIVGSLWIARWWTRNDGRFFNFKATPFVMQKKEVVNVWSVLVNVWSVLVNVCVSLSWGYSCGLYLGVVVVVYILELYIVVVHLSSSSMVCYCSAIPVF